MLKIVFLQGILIMGSKMIPFHFHLASISHFIMGKTGKNSWLSLSISRDLKGFLTLESEILIWRLAHIIVSQFFGLLNARRGLAV